MHVLVGDLTLLLLTSADNVTLLAFAAERRAAGRSVAAAVRGGSRAA